MRSVKPGRGPSFMGGVFGVVAAGFGVVWTLVANAMGAPWFFSAFGVAFMILAVCIMIYNFSNATRKNRFSAFDITDAGEETDPLNARFGGNAASGAGGEGDYCPFCGAKTENEYNFCRKCGKELPKE